MRTTITLAPALAAAVLAGCATNPATGERNFMLITEAQEIELGGKAAPEIAKQFGGAYPDEEVQRLVQSVGMRLAKASARPELPWSFQVVSSPDLNAFALPGGPIFITAGLLAKLENEAELAGVLGHEVGHVAARHQAQQISRSAALQTALGVGVAVAGGSEAGRGTQAAATGAQVAGQLLLLKYGRDAESESDKLGMDYAAKAGYDPRGVPALLTILLDAEKASGGARPPAFLLTHPATDRRVADANAYIRERFGPDQLARLRKDSADFDAAIARVKPAARPPAAQPTTVPAGTGKPEGRPPDATSPSGRR